MRIAVDGVQNALTATKADGSIQHQPQHEENGRCRIAMARDFGCAGWRRGGGPPNLFFSGSGDRPPGSTATGPSCFLRRSASFFHFCRDDSKKQTLLFSFLFSFLHAKYFSFHLPRLFLKKLTNFLSGLVKDSCSDMAVITHLLDGT